MGFLVNRPDLQTYLRLITTFQQANALLMATVKAKQQTKTMNGIVDSEILKGNMSSFRKSAKLRESSHKLDDAEKAIQKTMLLTLKGLQEIVERGGIFEI